MIESIPLPTDNLYKMVFFAGLALWIWSAIPFYRMYQVDIERERLSGQIENLHNREAWLEEDGKPHEEAVSKFRKEKEGKWEALPQLDPNSEEYARFLAGINDKKEIGTAQPRQVFWMDVEKFTRANEEKKPIIEETQKKLAAAEERLRDSARDIVISRIQLKAKSAEQDEAKRFVRSQMCLGIVGVIAGTVCIVFGAYNWAKRKRGHSTFSFG